MPYSSRAEAVLCLYDDFKCFLIKTMQPEYSRHSIEVPQTDWQEQFDRLEAWNQTVHYGQIPHTETYTRQQHKFPLNVLHAQENLIRHIKDEVSKASSFLTEEFEKQAENERKESDKEKRKSGKKVEFEEWIQIEIASGERGVEGLSDQSDSQDQIIISYARRLGSEGRVLEAHREEIANTITCLISTTKLTGSRKGLDFNELDERLCEKNDYPDYGALSRSEVRRELLEKIELNEATLERCTQLSEDFSRLLEKAHRGHWGLKDKTMGVLATPSTKSDRSDGTREQKFYHRKGRKPR